MATQFLLTVMGPEVRRLGLMAFENFKCFSGNSVLSSIYATMSPQNTYSLHIFNKMVGIEPACFTGALPVVCVKDGCQYAEKSAFGGKRYCFQYPIRIPLGFMSLMRPLTTR